MFKQITGIIGSLFASLCCLGFAPLLAALIGLQVWMPVHILGLVVLIGAAVCDFMLLKQPR